jgi:hypothetical protein
MLGFDYFYNESIKNMIVTFGSLFNEVYISRARKDTNSVLIKVPLHYGDQSKVYMYSKSGNNPFNSIWPRMAFDYGIGAVDDQRKTSRTIIHNFGKSVNNTGEWSSRNFIPYDFTFNLYIGASDIQDGLQIVEQVLPFFQPELTVKIRPLKDFPDFIADVPIELLSVTTDYEADGEIEAREYYNWTLSFNLKGFLFSPVIKDAYKVIDAYDINLKDFNLLQQDAKDMVAKSGII